MKTLRNITLIIICFVTSFSCLVGTAFLCDKIVSNKLGLGLLRDSFLNLNNGTYYLVRNGNIDENNYIKLENGKWTDSDNATGEYKISKGEITLYADNGAVFMRGTIDDDIMEFEILFSTLTYQRAQILHPPQ